MHAPEVSPPMAIGPGQQAWPMPALGDILGCALPHLGLGDRLLLRTSAWQRDVAP